MQKGAIYVFSSLFNLTTNIIFKQIIVPWIGFQKI